MNEAELGPAMQALTNRPRRFVLAVLSDPYGNAKQWAIAAGYSNHKEAAKVRGHHLIHSAKVQKAIAEEARRHLDSVGPALSIAVMMRIARKQDHRDQLKAAEMLADRCGFSAKTEHKVTVEHIDDSRLLQIAERMASELGVTPAKLIGGNVIEGEVVEVPVEPTPDR